MKHGMRIMGLVLLAIVLLGASTSVAFGGVGPSPFKGPPVNLGRTASYGLFSHRGTIGSNFGTATCDGDVGIWNPVGNGPGFNPALLYGVDVHGATHLNDAEASDVATDLKAAWIDGWNRTPTFEITAPTIGDGETLKPGVYHDGHAEESIDVSGTLYLDAQGDPNGVFIFQSHDAINFRDGSRIVLVNGARFCRVFWIGYDADVSANVTFVGHLITMNNITVFSGATINGQLLAGADPMRGGGINLSGNVITNGPCTPRLPRTGYPPERSRAELPVALCALAAMAFVLMTARRRAFDS